MKRLIRRLFPMFYWHHAFVGNVEVLSAHFKSTFSSVFTSTNKVKSALNGDNTIGSLLTETSKFKKA